MTLADISPEVWQGFAEMRRKIRAPLTERAITLTLNELERLRWAGYDPNEVLDQSTQRGWRGVFAIHGQEPVLRDRNGSRYKISVDGTREYLQ